jgi:hypothetical protein
MAVQDSTAMMIPIKDKVNITGDRISEMGLIKWPGAFFKTQRPVTDNVRVETEHMRIFGMATNLNVDNWLEQIMNRREVLQRPEEIFVPH